MGKIVAIVSSPRPDGSSAAIVDAITDGAMGLSTNVIKLHRLDALNNVHGCKACMRCKTTGVCARVDDISPILEDIKDADCVIFSTPVYFSETTAQYKILQDRMYSLLGSDGKKFIGEGKKAIVVVTAGAPAESVQPVADKMAMIIKCFGFDINEVVVYSDKSGAAPAREDAEFMKKMKEVGLRFRNNWPS